MSVRVGYLPVGEERAFVALHEPSVPGPARQAVLLCPPFGWEDTASYRARHAWGEHLAAGGRWALRFDPPGTGDSTGAPTDPGRLDAWVGAAAAAARWLRGETAAGRLVALGIGVGGLLAWRAAAVGAPIDDLVLWGTPAAGRTAIRELKAFARLEASRLVESGGTPPPPPPEGTLAPGGFLLSADTLAALSELRVRAADLRDAGGRRILALGRDGIAVDKDLLAELERSGAQLTVADGPGHGAMMVQPDEARPPLRTFAAVDAWLDAAHAEPEPAPRRIPPLEEELRLDAGDGEVVERPLRAGPLFGILAAPAREPSSDVTVVLLNAGAIRRTGPNRMWVEAARRWAARGVVSFRLDVEGIGDADGDATRYTRLMAFYTPDTVGQVRAALDALQALGRPPRFVAVGLCSGAYWAFHAALEDERVVAAQLVNPRALYWDEGLEARREARRLRLLSRGTTWRRLGRGEVGPARVGRFVTGTAHLARQLPARIREGRGTLARIDAAFDRLADARKPVLFVFGAGEPLRDELERARRLPPQERWPNLDLELVDGRDHTLRPLSMQRQVHEILDRALERTL